MKNTLNRFKHIVEYYQWDAWIIKNDGKITAVLAGLFAGILIALYIIGG